MAQPIIQNEGFPVDEPEQETLPIGTVLGSYRIERVLGIGGMGTVYLAVHQRLGRKVALKMLHPEFATNPTAVRRLFAEARAVNQIRHDNIVEITDFVETGHLKYYIMELLEGQDLSELQTSEQILGIGPAMRIAVQIADALEAVHAGGIVHRDLKPANVFVTERGGRKDFVKLLDFGVAKLMDQPSGDAMSRTAAGSIVGTPDYMSPEQAVGKPVDHRTDVYSLGVILYEMVVGVKPFLAHSLGELVVKHLTINPVKPSKVKNLPHEIPSDLEKIILSCLEKDAARRPQSIGEVAAKLREIGMSAGDWSLGTTGEYAAVTGIMPARRSPRLLVGGLILAGVAATAVAVNWPEPSSRPVNPPSIVMAAPVKTEVELTIDSRPSGAMVLLGEEKTPLGFTPLSQVFPLSDEIQKVELQLDGYEPATSEIPLDSDLRINLVLKPIAAAVKTPVVVKRKKKKKKTHKRGVIDPFAN